MNLSELNWTVSSRCEAGHCVSVAFDGDRVLVRDDKHPEDGTIVYTREQWLQLLDQVREDRWVDDVWYPCDWRGDPEEVWWRGDVDLYFTRDEIAAFIGDEDSGVIGGEFDLPEPSR